MESMVNRDSYLDFLIYTVTVAGACFAMGVLFQEQREKDHRCDGTPFSYTKELDGNLTCYYKLDRSSYTTTKVKKGRA